MNQTLELIRQRISINKFDTTKSLSEDEIRELVSYATQSPSAYNIQHWRFIALVKQEDKERLKALAYKQQKGVDASVTFIVLGDLQGYEKLPEILAPLVESGQMSQEAVDKWATSSSKSYINNDRFARDEAIRSASMAAMTLMIAAQAKGLVSGPMIGFDAEAVKREFNIPDRYVPAMLLTVGYPAPGNSPRKPRLTADQVLAFGAGREF